MMTSDFRPEVEIQPFRACLMKNMQYSPYLWPNCRNFRVLKKIWIEEHDGDVEDRKTRLSYNSETIVTISDTRCLSRSSLLFIDFNCFMHPSIFINFRL